MPRCLLLLAVLMFAVGCSENASESGGTGGDATGSGGTAGGAGTAGSGGGAGAQASGGSSGHGGASGTDGLGGGGGIQAGGGRGGSAGAGGLGGSGGTSGCPVIQSLSATPSVIASGQTQSIVEVEATDPEPGPDPIRTRLSATTGTFEDPEAVSTVFTCGSPGVAEITATATDGDPDCLAEQTITVDCPQDIPINLCPNLFTVNAIPSRIPAGQDSTEVETRALDPDDGPLPLVTTFYSLRGTFDDPNAEDTIYRCERGGLNEICVDASDGACVKTLCTDVFCPDE